MRQEGRFFGITFGSLMKNDFSLMKKVLVSVAKSLLIPSELATSAADASMQKKIHGPGHLSELAQRTTTLVISNKQIDDTIKIDESF